MRLCLTCRNAFAGPAWHCPQCGWTPSCRGGVIHLTPDVPDAEESYDPRWYAELHRLEEANFWFKARNQLIKWLAARYVPAEAVFLELGCGTGYVLRMLRHAFPSWHITASEVHSEGLAFAAAASAGQNVSFQQMDARALPYRDEFDAVGAFDVIEHIREDVDVLNQIRIALKPGGVLLASVPQHMFLWSKFDEIGKHFRRYSANEVREKLARSGLELIATTSFNSLLLPAMWISRMSRKIGEDVDILDELRVSPRLNGVLAAVLRFEVTLVRMGIRWPVGGSRVFVARKPL